MMYWWHVKVFFSTRKCIAVLTQVGKYCVYNILEHGKNFDAVLVWKMCSTIRLLLKSSCFNGMTLDLSFNAAMALTTLFLGIIHYTPLFRLFSNKLQYNLTSNRYVKKCPVYGAGIRTHDLQNVSLLQSTLSLAGLIPSTKPFCTFDFMWRRAHLKRCRIRQACWRHFKCSSLNLSSKLF